MKLVSSFSVLLTLISMESLLICTQAEDVLPVYYAWFVEESDSLGFQTRSFKTLADCLQAVPEFLKDAQTFTGRVYVSDILAHYTRENSDEVLHCTAAYNGVYPNYTEGAVEYSKKPEVQASLNKGSVLHSIGWIFTPRTFGARINLKDDQLLLWNQDDNEGNPSSKSTTDQGKSRETMVTQRDLTIDETVVDQDPGILGNFQPRSGNGSRAHLTLGCAPGVSAVTTGWDLVDLIRLEERNSSSVKTYVLPSDGGWLRNYGDGQWVLYPKKQWLLDSTFEGYETASSFRLTSPFFLVFVTSLIAITLASFMMR